MKKNRDLSHIKGFTLIEVMIVLFVLVMIGTLTAKSIVEAGKLKVNLSEETDFSNELRTSLMFMERDLNQVFNPRWFLSPDLKPLDPYNTTPSPTPIAGASPPKAPLMTIEQLNRKLNNTAFQVYDFWGPVLDYTGIRASRFKATDVKMSFVTSDHVRVYKQKRESIYAKVTYELIKDTLYKTVSTHAFDLEEKKEEPFITTYVILSHLKNFKFKYFKEAEKDPVNEWDSEPNDARSTTKGVFPEAVQIEFEMSAPAGRTFSTKVLFKLETPNDVLPSTY